MVGLLGRVISPSQGLHRTTQHRKTRTTIHALSGTRAHDPSNQPAKTHASDRTATVTGTVNYLDLSMTHVRDKLEYKAYGKPTATERIIHHHSCLPMEHKLSSTNYLLLRLSKCPILENNELEYNTIKLIMTNNQYQHQIHLYRLISSSGW
jgi:hypothetical protein